MILQAPHTHLYPGLEGKFYGLAQSVDSSLDGGCLVEFSDGSSAIARISKPGDDWLLETDAYCTAAGTKIDQKCWRLHLRQDEDRMEFRILEKMPSS